MGIDILFHSDLYQELAEACMILPDGDLGRIGSAPVRAALGPSKAKKWRGHRGTGGRMDIGGPDRL